MVSDLMTPPVVIGPVPSNQPARAYPVNGWSVIHPGIGYNLQIASAQEDARTARNCRSRTLADLDPTLSCICLSICSISELESLSSSSPPVSFRNRFSSSSGLSVYSRDVDQSWTHLSVNGFERSDQRQGSNTLLIIVSAINGN